MKTIDLRPIVITKNEDGTPAEVFDARDRILRNLGTAGSVGTKHPVQYPCWETPEEHRKAARTLMAIQSHVGDDIEVSDERHALIVKAFKANPSPVPSDCLTLDRLEGVAPDAE